MKTAERLLGQLDVTLGGLAVEHGHCGLVREAPGAPDGPHPLQLGRGEGLHHQQLRGNRGDKCYFGYPLFTFSKYMTTLRVDGNKETVDLKRNV